ncbi:hypothetical protein C0995_011218 [Termitomyces sp. Mi166|nr:hypothetical protein C0995_011218 [Termitomyces sp. Mi166\
MPLADFSLSPQMASKILLLNVSPDACLLERELAAQKFIIAANAVFLKAQGLATLVPLHEMAFGLLEGLLDNWCQLNLMTIEWLHKAEVRQACINIWSLNKQVPWAAEFRKTVVSWEHTISTIEQIKLMHFEKMVMELESSMPTVVLQPIVNPAPTPVSTTSSIQHLLSELSLQEQEEVRSAVLGAFSSPQKCSSRRLVPQNKGKGKAKVTEDDDDDEETAQKLRKELEEFVAPTTTPQNKGKGKAKAMEDDNNNKEATQKLRKELEDFVVLTTFDNKLLASLLPPPSEYFKGDSALP